MKPRHERRAAALSLMAAVAAVGLVRGLLPISAEAAPAPAPVLVRPQTSSGDPMPPADALFLDAPSPGSAGRDRPARLSRPVSEEGRGATARRSESH